MAQPFDPSFPFPPAQGNAVFALQNTNAIAFIVSMIGGGTIGFAYIDHVRNALSWDGKSKQGAIKSLSPDGIVVSEYHEDDENESGTLLYDLNLNPAEDRKSKVNHLEENGNDPLTDNGLVEPQDDGYHFVEIIDNEKDTTITLDRQTPRTPTPAATATISSTTQATNGIFYSYWPVILLAFLIYSIWFHKKFNGLACKIQRLQNFTKHDIREVHDRVTTAIDNQTEVVNRSRQSLNGLERRVGDLENQDLLEDSPPSEENDAILSLLENLERKSNSKIAALEKKIGDLEKERNSTLTKLKFEQMQLQGQIQSLQNAQKNTVAITELDGFYQDMNGRVNGLREDMLKHQEEIDDLKEAFDNCDRKETGLRSDIESRDKKISHIEQAHRELKTEGWRSYRGLVKVVEDLGTSHTERNQNIWTVLQLHHREIGDLQHLVGLVPPVPAEGQYFNDHHDGYNDTFNGHDYGDDTDSDMEDYDTDTSSRKFGSPLPEYECENSGPRSLVLYNTVFADEHDTNPEQDDSDLDSLFNDTEWEEERQEQGLGSERTGPQLLSVSAPYPFLFGASSDTHTRGERTALDFNPTGFTDLPSMNVD